MVDSFPLETASGSLLEKVDGTRKEMKLLAS
jgi:hypothetical protein